MMAPNTLREQTLAFRKMIVGLLEGMAANADRMPLGWNNNARWHAGHLITTPRLLTLGLMKEDLGMPAEYRTWFAKGSSPAVWPGQPVPSYDDLLAQLRTTADEVFDKLEGRMEAPFAAPYTTSVGVVLTNPREALTFSLGHDGIHLGMLLSLRRALAM